MDRAMLIEHLALAEEHIQTGSRNIARQEQLIAELEADEATLSLCFADQERIKKELEQTKYRPPPQPGGPLIRTVFVAQAVKSCRGHPGTDSSGSGFGFRRR